MQDATGNTALRPFLLSGKVVRGHGRGGTCLGTPTANLMLNDDVIAQLQPYKNLVLYGWGIVVAVPGKEAAGGEGPYPFVMSIGYNPHFKDVSLSAEVHFMHQFAEDFYGAIVKIVVLGTIREMGAFVSLEALVDAIKNDIKLTKEALQKPELARQKEHIFLSLSLKPSEAHPYFEATVV
ncbi:riboflavin kinase [Trypanosoma rangeli]|uniref:riboflavin kinase n=1 Tax=Trypanosoma rangeli TaxID=5698 RepID=A0A3R7RGI7_TRYRA|nr:riboflavin kinase [Trypanosoma rangeli]RNF02271.1 riboflavin kinase [Trypanosoma rangeli]|eukprot:RNF02271.1 riboflavin kinase [Trypanosoma rangeli]